MANSENPLHNFRTYSYHHILIAADTTKVLKEMENGTIPLSSLISDNVRITSEFDSGEKIRVRSLESGEGNYVVIMNGMQDCDFYISELKWESVFTPNYGSKDHESTTNIVGLEGTMTVIEPNNIRFMHFLNNVFNALQSDPIGIVFILKTIFVGYPEDDNKRPEIISNVKPLGMTLYDMVSNFEATGSSYVLSFVGIANGAANLSQASSNIMSQVPAIPTSVNSYFPKDVSLFDKDDPRSQLAFRRVYYSDSAENIFYVLNRLEEELNKRYTDFFKKMKDSKKHRRVKYVIDMDDYYIQPENLYLEIPKMDAYRVDSVPSEYASKGRIDGDTNNMAIAFPPGTSVWGAIDIIMRCSQRVLYEANPKDPKQKKYTYKILTSIDISNEKIDDGIDSAGTYTISYMVKRQLVPEMTADFALNNPAATPEEQQKIAKEHGVLELDYFFTGKNVDILDLKLEMDMALAFLMIYSPADNLQNPPETQVAKGATHPQYSTREKSPLFPSRKVTKYDILQAPNPSESLSFQALLNKFSLISAIETKVKIIGNPILLNDCIKNTIPGHSKKRNGVKKESVKQERIEYVSRGTSTTPSEPEQTSIMKDWASSPALAKINIRMPVEVENSNYDGPIQSQPFWFQGYYYIFSVLNIFSEGAFEQEIELLALPEKESILSSTNNATSATSNPTPAITPDKPKERAFESVIQATASGFEFVDKWFRED